MSNRRTLMAAAAIVLALVAGIGVYMYASGADKRAQDNASFVSAYVANADIAKGTTGAEVLQAGLVDKEKVAKGSLPPSAITSLDQLNGKVLSGPVNDEAVHHHRHVRVGGFRPRQRVRQPDQERQPGGGHRDGRRRPWCRQPDRAG